MDNSNYNSIIWLSQGKYTIVDNEDYDFLNQWKWCLHCPNDTYAIRTDYSIKPKVKIRMHRLIANTPHKMHTDHINGNRLDNRKFNLRVCTDTQNKWNKKPDKTNTSGYKGVRWCKRDKCWIASIQSKYIGTYKTSIDAAKAYNLLAKKLYGKFAWLNPI